MVMAVGEGMVSALERIESNLFDGQVKFYHELTASEASAASASLVASLPDLEAAALEKVAKDLEEMSTVKKDPKPVAEMAAETPKEKKEEGDEEEDEEEEKAEEEEEEPETIELPETLKPFMEAVALLEVWTSAFETQLGAELSNLQHYVLPATAPVKNLVRMTALFTGTDPSVMLDIFGEISWDHLRFHVLPILPKALVAYNPAAEVTVTATGSLEAVRAEFEDAGLLEASSFPPELPVLAHLSAWMQKAFEARAAAMTHFEEVENKKIEIIMG